MQIHLAQSAGFCFGVRRAIKIARSLAASHKTVCMLGDLVHNETVIQELEAAGIRKIKRLGLSHNGKLLIRAHGASRRTLAMARHHGYALVNATCPMVREIHQIVRSMDRQGRRVIVIGDRRHDEVLGIIGQIAHRAVIIDHAKHIPWKALRHVRKAAIVVQSTQNLDRILPIVERLETRIADVRFFNTICKPTRLKQEEIKILPLQNDAILIVGSRTSANTKRLYEISKGLNSRTHWIQSPQELDPRWFRNVRSLGITTGASTPETTTRAVIARIRGIIRPTARRRTGA